MNSGRISWFWIPIQIFEFSATLPWLPMMQLWAWTPLYRVFPAKTSYIHNVKITYYCIWLVASRLSLCLSFNPPSPLVPAARVTRRRLGTSQSLNLHTWKDHPDRCYSHMINRPFHSEKLWITKWNGNLVSRVLSYKEPPLLRMVKWFGVHWCLYNLYYYMRNFCNLIGLEQWYFSLNRTIHDRWRYEISGSSPVEEIFNSFATLTRDNRAIYTRKNKTRLK